MCAEITDNRAGLAGSATQVPEPAVSPSSPPVSPRPVRERPPTIPERIWDTLLDLREELQEQGSIHERRPPRRPGHYRLRFRVNEPHVDEYGYAELVRRHEAIALGSAETAAAVQQVIDRWRTPEARREWRNRRLEADQRRQGMLARRLRLEKTAEIDAAHEEALAEDGLRTERPGRDHNVARTTRPGARESVGGDAEAATSSTPAGDGRAGDEKPRRDESSAAQVHQGFYPRLSAEATKILDRGILPRNIPEMLCSEATVRDDPQGASEDAMCVGIAQGLGWEAATRIPPALRRRLEGLRSALETNGSIIERREPGRRPSYRLRVRAPHEAHGRVQLAVPIPAECVKDVEAVIIGWRAPSLIEARKRRRLKELVSRERKQLRLMLRSIRLAGRDSREYQEILGWHAVYSCLFRGSPVYEEPVWSAGHTKQGFSEEIAF